MPSFKTPIYSKTTNPKTGAQEPTYVFNIEFSQDENGLSTLIESAKDITLNTLQTSVVGNIKWWNAFMDKFLTASAKLFSKPYTVEQINKITKHTLEGTTNNTFPANITFLPKNITIVGGVFMVNWLYVIEPVVIDIPDLGEDAMNTIELAALPDSEERSVTDGIEELNIDDLPVDKNATDDSALDLESPARFYDKQRVKEARLKAKLAVYKAQRQMAQYYQKYGGPISDSESDSDYVSDEESDDDDEENGGEEVQL